MKHIQVSEVQDLHKYAKKTHELGDCAPTQEFDSAVGHLIQCWDELCNLLEERGRQAAERWETVSVDGLDEAEALGKTKAAVYAIDSARRHHRWKYQGDLPNERKFLQSDVNVVGLLALKRRFNDFLDQERRYGDVGPTNAGGATELSRVRIKVNGVTIEVTSKVGIREVLTKARDAGAIEGLVEEYVIERVEEEGEIAPEEIITVKELEEFLAVPTGKTEVA